MEALRLDGITLDLPGRRGILQDVGLIVAPGELVVLRGRSGSGKSSLLSVAAGLQPPTKGTVQVMGSTLSSDPEANARVRHDHVGLIFQHLNLLDELSVGENVELPLALRHVRSAQRKARAAELLERFGIADLADRRPHQLSGGELQRVAIARALAARPAILLVDEPTSNLDEENAKNVIVALQAASAEGAGVLVATHDELFRGAGRAYRLQAGRIVGGT